MQPNPGRIPPETEIRDPETGEITGHRAVMVKLFNGIVAGPWPSAGGRPHQTNWKISRKPHGFEIEFWEII